MPRKVSWRSQARLVGVAGLEGLEAVDGGIEPGVEPGVVGEVLFALELEEGGGEAVDLGPSVELELVQLVLQLVEALRVDLVGGGRGLVIVLEAGEDVVALVDEVEYEGLLLAPVHPVEAREGLHGLDAGQPLVDVHGAQQGLIEAGLVLVGDNQHPVSV